MQTDITLSSTNKELTLTGLRDHGDFLEGLNTAYEKPSSDEGKIPDKVLQLIFNGLAGFKFPVAHYPVANMSGRELRAIIDENITALSHHDFQVHVHVHANLYPYLYTSHIRVDTGRSCIFHKASIDILYYFSNHIKFAHRFYMS